MGLFSRKKNVEPAPEVAATTSADVIAAISAAIAAYEGESGATTNLIIRKIDRTAGTLPAWGVAGNREAIDTRRM